jgi:hypothetical protein
MDSRLLLPASILISLACISLIWSFSKIQGHNSIWYSFILFILFSVSVNSNSTIEAAIQLHDSGRGFSSQYWLDSEIIQYLNNDLDNRKVYSNGSDIIRFLSEKEASPLPKKISTRTKKPNDEYNEQLRQILTEVNDGTARIVYFNSVDQWELPSIEELEINGQLSIQGEYEDGVILAIP